MKQIAITVVAFLILLSFIVLGYFVIQQANKNDDLLDRIAEQQISYLNNISEFSDNYNELYQEYQELYSDYNRLHVSLSNAGWQEYIITGYSANDSTQGTNNTTATGIKCDSNIPIIATDPEIIPLYSIVEIDTLGAYVALDVGGKIIGNRIDILFDNKTDALSFGTNKLLARILR